MEGVGHDSAGVLDMVLSFLEFLIRPVNEIENPLLRGAVKVGTKLREEKEVE